MLPDKGPRYLKLSRFWKQSVNFLRLEFIYKKFGFT